MAKTDPEDTSSASDRREFERKLDLKVSKEDFHWLIGITIVVILALVGFFTRRSERLDDKLDALTKDVTKLQVLLAGKSKP